MRGVQSYNMVAKLARTVQDKQQGVRFRTIIYSEKDAIAIKTDGSQVCIVESSKTR
jgi:hypothetical protein